MCLFQVTSICPWCLLGPDLLGCLPHRSRDVALEACVTQTSLSWLSADLFPALLDLLPLAWPDPVPTHHFASHEKMPWARELYCMVSEPSAAPF